MSVAQHVASVLQLKVQLVRKLLDHGLQAHLGTNKRNNARQVSLGGSACFSPPIVTAERPPHLLGYPPQLVVTVASVWVQVHPERSSENEDFLVKPKGKQGQSESPSIPSFPQLLNIGDEIVIFQTENSA